MTQFIKTEKNRVKRIPERGQYDRQTIFRILDEALICHVGFAVERQPYVIPINFARIEDTIVMHGAKASRLLKHIEAGESRLRGGDRHRWPGFGALCISSFHKLPVGCIVWQGTLDSG